MRLIKILGTFLFLFSFATSSAQYNLDSLKSVWQDQSYEDTTRLNTMVNILSHGRILSYHDSILHYSDLLIDNSITLKSERHLAQGLFFKGYYFILNSQIDRGTTYIDSGLVIFQEIQQPVGIASGRSMKGLLLIFKGEIEEGFLLCEESYKQMEKIGNIKGMQECATNLHQAYQIKGDLEKSIEYAHLSVRLAEETENYIAMATSYHNMADVYLNLDITDEGNYYHEKSLEYCQKSEFISEEIRIKSHLAALESSKENYAESLKLLEEVYKWEIVYGSKLRLVLHSSKKISILVKAKMYDEAKVEIQKYRNKWSANEAIIQFHNGIVDYSEGTMLMDLGNSKKGAELCLSAYNFFQGYNQYSFELDACECLFKGYTKMGDSENALKYYELHQEIQKLLNKEKAVKDLQKFEFHKQMIADSLAQVEKDKLVQLAHEEEVKKENRTKNIALASGLALLILAGGLYSRVRYIRKSKSIIESERDRSENLLLNILPEEIAQELKEKGKADARDFEMVSILFTDFKGFTEQSAKLSAADLVNEINHCFEAFDGIMEKYNIEKIKTIGDAYMAAGGLPVPTDDSVKNTVLAALEMQDFIIRRKAEKDSRGEPAFEMRVGIHTGPVVAGIVGVKKFQYDIWGDTVNTASRMESSGEVGKLNISQATYELLKDDTYFKFESRGMIKAKGKGEIEMYFASKA